MPPESVGCHALLIITVTKQASLLRWQTMNTSNITLTSPPKTVCCRLMLYMVLHSVYSANVNFHQRTNSSRPNILMSHCWSENNWRQPVCLWHNCQQPTTMSGGGIISYSNKPGLLLFTFCKTIESYPCLAVGLTSSLVFMLIYNYNNESHHGVLLFDSSGKRFTFTAECSTFILT